MDFDSEAPIVNLPQTISIEDAFRAFFKDEILEDIVHHTNNAFQHKVNKNTVLKLRDQRWYPLDKSELLKYIGIIITMGQIKLPELSYHWKIHSIFTSGLVSKTMSINRFKAIGRYLATGPIDKEDKLSRIRTLSDSIQESSIKFYLPRKELSVDESMIGFTGRHEFKQYMPMKPTKWGFKAFLLYESTTGYCLKHTIFTQAGQVEFQTRNLCNNYLKDSSIRIMIYLWTTFIHLFLSFLILVKKGFLQLERY